MEKKQRSAERRFRRVHEFLTTNPVEGTAVKVQVLDQVAGPRIPDRIVGEQRQPQRHHRQRGLPMHGHRRPGLSRRREIRRAVRPGGERQQQAQHSGQ